MTDSSPDRTRRKHRWPRRVLRNALVLLVLGIAVQLLLPQIAALRHSLQVIRTMSLWLFGVAVATQVLSYVGRGYLLRCVTALFGHGLRMVRSVMITLASSSLGLLWGGQVTYAGATFRWMRASGVPPEGAVLTGWLPPIVNVFTLSAVSLFGLLYLLGKHQLTAALTVGFLCALLLLGVTGFAGWLALRNRQRFTRLLHRIGGKVASMRHRAYDPAPVDHASARLFEALDVLRRGGWRGVIVGDVMNVGFDILTLYFTFRAAGFSPSPGVLLAGYGLPLLIGKIAVIPGGVGLVEGTMAALYEALGIPSAITVVVILAFRVLSFWLPMALGFPLVPVLDKTQ